MNSRGIIFTISVLTLILAIIYLTTAFSQSEHSIANAPELSALKIAGQKYRDISRSLLELDLNGPKKTVLSMGLPFSYSADRNQFQITQRFPVNAIEIATYHNSLNGYRIFFQNQSLQGLPTGFFLDINTIKDANWGGTNNRLNFLLNRQCMAYRFSANQIQFENAGNSQCTGAFNAINTRKTNAQLLFLDLREDLNVSLCNAGACPNNAFNPNDPNPYFSLQFNTQDCVACNLSPIATHFDPATDYNIFLHCPSDNCFSKPIQIILGNQLSLSRDQNQTIILDMNFEFNQTITRFVTLDANVTLTVPDYNIIRTNNPSQIQ